MSHHNIGPEGAVSLANGLNHLTKIKLLFLSNNNIDLNGATVIIKALKHCLDLRTVDMNLDSQMVVFICMVLFVVRMMQLLLI